MTAMGRNALLGDFVRAHRERLSPEAPAGRRRTPGMRREELAAKAGMSSTWCAWIEQGREVQASPEALGRLARALVLSRAERAYLFELSGRRDPELAASDPMPDAPASLRAIVAALEDPAYGLDRCGTPAAGTRPRNNCSWAGSTASVSAICCASSSSIRTPED
jgi:transcriptional regulator with XRE-family HTH domain